MIYLILFYEFFKIGLFTFGGGNAMIPLLRDTVLKYGWISEDSFYDFIGLCESTPGPIAINMATFVGNSQGGILGGIIATLGVVLPAFLIILLIVVFLNKLTSNKYYKASMEGAKPVVTALILVSGLLVLAKVIIGSDFKNPQFDLRGLISFAIVCGVAIGWKLIFKKKINSVILILISCVIGLGIGLIFAQF